jgi:integrase
VGLSTDEYGRILAAAAYIAYTAPTYLESARFSCRQSEPSVAAIHNKTFRPPWGLRIQMAHLTKQIVETAKAPADGQRFIRDDQIKGLALRITANGVKSFVWEGRIKGRMRRITLGQFPAITVVLARDKALEMKAAISRGGDPALERQQEREEPTFGNLTVRYLDEHAKPHKKSWKRDESRIEAHFSKWNSRRVNDVSADEVARLHHAISEAHGKVAANRAIELLRVIFNLGRDWGYLNGANPAARVKRFHENKQERFLSPDEMHRLNSALADEKSIYWRAFFALSLMIGTRKNELLSARWSDLDLEKRTWQIPMTKAGRSHLLPIPAPATELLKALPSRNIGEFVFPGRGKTGHLVEPRKTWERIRKAANLSDARIHDLRRTFGSWLAAQGYSLPLIGRALNHSNAASTSIYARIDLDPVRAALENNAALMLAPAPDKIELSPPIDVAVTAASK